MLLYSISIDPDVSISGHAAHIASGICLFQVAHQLPLSDHEGYSNRYIRSEFCITRLKDKSNLTCTIIRYIAAKATAIPTMFNNEDEV